jgi:hypothetical protein
LKWIEIDFSYFKRDSQGSDLHLHVFKETRRIEEIPGMVAVFSTPRNVCYYKDGVTYIDYFGRGLAIYDRKSGRVDIYSEDPVIIHSASYESILSLVGQYLDGKAWHRIHGVGFDVNGKAAIVMLDSGSGKTELAMRFLRSKAPQKLISEDTPLVTREGKVLPFPLRIGVINAEAIADIPESAKVYFPRTEFGPKYLADVTYFKDKIATKSSSAWILVMGKRSTLDEPKIYAVPKIAVLGNVFKNHIMGLGVYHGLEFILKATPFDLFKKTGLVFSRIINSIILIARSRTFSLILSKDTEKNCALLEKFFQEQQ